jgi:hypothetical protein
MGVILAYNDISIARGGVFDLNQDFRSTHSEHKTRGNIDVRGIALKTPFRSTKTYAIGSERKYWRSLVSPYCMKLPALRTSIFIWDDAHG